MNVKSIQILFSKDELDYLEKQSVKAGLTVPLYIKGKVLPQSEFNSCYSELLKKVEELPIGTNFNIKMLFGTQWTMSKGVKLTLGKTFYSKVVDGTIKNVEVEGKDSSNVMWYRKRGVM